MLIRIMANPIPAPGLYVKGRTGMSEAKAKFFKICVIEIEDLIDDVTHLIDSHRRRMEKGEITDYVFRENVALLSAEKIALGHFLKVLGEFDTAEYGDINALASGIEKRFTRFLQEQGYSQALELIMAKKIRKARDYCGC